MVTGPGTRARLVTIYRIRQFANFVLFPFVATAAALAIESEMFMRRCCCVACLYLGR